MCLKEDRSAGSLIDSAGLHADDAVLDDIDDADSVRAAEFVERADDIGDFHFLAVDGGRHTLFECEREVGRFIRRCLRGHAEHQHMLIIRCQGRIFKNPGSRLDRYRLRWNDVVYSPGEIRVVAYDKNGSVVGEKTVRSAGKAAKILLEPDRNVLKADDNDLAFVTVSMVDENGTLVPDADNELEFEVVGNGAFKAVCNGDATSLESFTEPHMRLFHGQLVVVVQAGNKTGNITIKVKDKQKRTPDSETTIMVN